MTEQQSSATIGDVYIRKIRKKISSLEREIHTVENTIRKENKTREKLWSSSSETGEKIQESQQFTLQSKEVLALAYVKLADLKRLEARGLEQRAFWLKTSENFEIAQRQK